MIINYIGLKLLFLTHLNNKNWYIEISNYDVDKIINLNTIIEKCLAGIGRFNLQDILYSRYATDFVTKILLNHKTIGEVKRYDLDDELKIKEEEYKKNLLLILK